MDLNDSLREADVRARLGRSRHLVGIGAAGPTIIAHGSDAQKQRQLEPMPAAQQGIYQLFPEPGEVGSDTPFEPWQRS